jgi:ribosomal protein S18 acetylase RimI-like enzyme
MGETVEEISIACGGGELLDRIERLWVELREHHAGLSAAWRDGLLKGSFPERRAELVKKGSRGLLVMLASSGEETIGYCVCTIEDSGQGEIDSIFVTQRMRGRGMGKLLMNRAMDWLRDKKAEPIVVEVMAGNTQAAKLYEQFGFRMRTLRMRYVGDGRTES